MDSKLNGTMLNINLHKYNLFFRLYIFKYRHLVIARSYKKYFVNDLLNKKYFGLYFV